MEKNIAKFSLLYFKLFDYVLCRVLPDMRARLGPAVFGRVVWQQDGAPCHTANMVSLVNKHRLAMDLNFLLYLNKSLYLFSPGDSLPGWHLWCQDAGSEEPQGGRVGPQLSRHQPL